MTTVIGSKAWAKILFHRILTDLCLARETSKYIQEFLYGRRTDSPFGLSTFHKGTKFNGQNDNRSVVLSMPLNFNKKQLGFSLFHCEFLSKVRRVNQIFIPWVFEL